MVLGLRFCGFFLIFLTSEMKVGTNVNNLVLGYLNFSEISEIHEV